MFRKIFLFCYFFLFEFIAISQQLYFKTLTVNDGLSQHDVSCILQDSYGFTWIGTYDGLNRFDGYNVLNFYHKTNDSESLSSNRIICLFEDSKKRIWIGTDGSGLNYYSLIKEKFVRIETPKGFDRIADIVETSKGELIIATSNGILKVINDDKPSVDILQLPITGLRITDIAILNDDKIFFSTNHGIWYLQNNECFQLKGTENNFCSRLIKDRNSNIWSIINGKLKVIKSTQNFSEIEEIKTLPNFKNSPICESKDGTIWVGSDVNGLFGISPKDFTIGYNIKYNALENRGLLSNSIISLYCDKDNILWIGNRQGLCYTNLSKKGFQHVSYEGMNNVSYRPHIRTLLVDENKLYYGIQNRGFFLYNLSNKKSEELISNLNINPLCLSKINGKIYVGTNNGVFTNSNGGTNFTSLNIIPNHDSVNPVQVFSMCSDEKNNEYFGTFSGLIVRKGNVTDWIHYLYPQAEILRGKRIFSLLYDKASSCIWIGTISAGLYKINLTQDGNFLSIETYNESMKSDYHITENTIWCFYNDDEGNLWIGTDAGLFKKTKKSNAISQINISEIINKKIMGIIGDNDGNLWLNNSQGIICFNINNNKVRRYTYNDGLQSSTFTEAIDKGNDGMLYFGGTNGIDFFNPKQIETNPYKASIAISDFKVHNLSVFPNMQYFGSTILEKSINLTNEITLNYKQNNFQFEFTSTSFANTAESHFRYKLEGYDSGWIYKSGKSRFASYSNLDPGKYIFWADAANSDGVWSDNPKKIVIKILPAFWLSFWAYLVYCIAGAGVIFGFITLRNKRQKLQHEIELKNIQHERDKEINELKLNFFTDVAHEFKTPLSLIVGPLNDLINNNVTEDHKNFCFKIISRNTKRMMLLVSQLLDFNKLNANKNILKISKNNLPEFIYTTTSAFLWQAKDEEINFNIITPEEFECYFDRDLIEKVLYNLLSNAFKHTPSNGIVEIEVKPIWNTDKETVQIIVRDNGKGIPNEQKSKIFERYFHGNQRSSSGIGLHLSYNLIKAHKGELTVADSAYGGTEFIVAIPVSKNVYPEIILVNEVEPIENTINFLLEMDESKKEYSQENELILIVEDDHDLRAYLKNCLKSNYIIIESQNGNDGYKKATEHSPDIIISDVMMPEMDGIELCKKLKENNETSHIPILLLTAKTGPEFEKEGLEAGAFDYIAKPFNTQSLLKKIDNIIESRKSFRNAISNFNLNVDIKKHYTSFDQKLISSTIKVIEENISDEEFSVEDLAKKVGFSRMQLHRKLKSLAGYSATEFINTIKINYATKMFDNGCDRVNEAMFAVGIISYSHFNKLFKKVNGKTASDYLRDKQTEKME
jgi:signal transduction histidine kinase/ligand-binding sensor domain-containing protein/DNA-binding response OmpR family regulator